MASPAAARIAAIASRQLGVVSRSQLLDLGMSSSTIARWLAAGHLHRLHRGVYAVGHPNVSREGRYMAAVLATGEGAILSHTPAARIQGLDRTRSAGTIHVTVEHTHRRSIPGLIVHRSRNLGPRDITRRYGIRVTTPTRILFDLSTLLSPAQLRDHHDQAVHLEQLDKSRLAELLEQSSGHRGAGNLRALLGEQPIPLSQIRSRLEGIVLKLCRGYSLPMPAVNVPLLDYEVDFFWPEARFVVEADGSQHTGPQRDKDNQRDLALQRAGHLVRRYGSETLKDRGAVAAEILAILRERL